MRPTRGKVGRHGDYRVHKFGDRKVHIVPFMLVWIFASVCETDDLSCKDYCISIVRFFPIHDFFINDLDFCHGNVY